MPGRDWEEDRPLKHKGRKKAAGRAAARSILEQVAWCSWPLIYWDPSAPGSPLRPKLAMRGPGIYAVKMQVGPGWRQARPVEEKLKALYPQVMEIVPINGPGLAAVLGQVLRSDHFERSLGRMVGDIDAWKERVETALKRARQALDAAREMTGPQALLLESLCWWVGAAGARPSSRFSNEIFATAGTIRDGAWGQAASALAGQRRSVRRPEGEAGVWYACGRALGDWPLDAIMQVGRAIGPGDLARRVAAAPELGRAEVAAVVREVALCGASSADLRQMLGCLPRLLELSRLIAPERWERGKPSSTLLPELLRMGLWRFADEEIQAIIGWMESRHAHGADTAPALLLSGLMEVAGVEGLDSARRAAAIKCLERHGGPLTKEDQSLAPRIRLLMQLGALGAGDEVAKLVAGPLYWCASELERSSLACLGPLIQWVQRMLLSHPEPSQFLSRIGLAGEQGVRVAWAIAAFDVGLVIHFVEWVAEWEMDGESLAWLGRYSGLGRASWIEPLDNTRRAFLRRHLREMTELGDRLGVSELGLARWRRCVEVAGAWEGLGWPDPRRAFRRFLEECVRRPKWQPFAGQAEHLWPLKLAERDLDRAIALGSIRKEMDWDQVELIEQAWKALDAPLRERLSGLMIDERLALRAMRWLARAGFCLRLDRRANWQTQAAVSEPCDVQEARLARWNIPEACRAGLAELLMLIGAADLPGKVVEVLSRPQRLKQELAVLETMEHLPPAAWRRVENLKKWLREPNVLQDWLAHDLASALREAIDEAFLAGLEKQAAQVVLEHLERVIGHIHVPPKDARDWDNAVRLYYSTQKNRKVLRRLMIRESRGDRSWIGEHPGNKRFLEAISERGIDVQAWLRPLSQAVAVPVGTWHIAIEDEPLAVLQMGNYFGTCLSERGVNSYATIANAVELNKRVIYVRDERGQVVGRKLIAMNWEGRIVGFRSYGVGPLDPWIEQPGASPWMKLALDLFCRHLADRCGGALHPFPRGDDGKEMAQERPLALFCQWYNDGPEDFDRVWLEWGPLQFRQSVREKGVGFDRMLEMLSSQEGPDQSQALRVLVWLGDDADGLLAAFADSREGGGDEAMGRIGQYLGRHRMPGRGVA